VISFLHSYLNSTKINDSFTLRDAILTARKFTANESVALKLIDKATSEEEVMPNAIQIAEKYAAKGENKRVLQQLKTEMYRYAYDKLMSGDLGFGQDSVNKIAKL
jgi:enoyl-CoA hydratase/carnithine racemase